MTLFLVNNRVVQQSEKEIFDFRKSLQERLDNVNPRRKLANNETINLAKIEDIAEKLKHGENVQNR